MQHAAAYCCLNACNHPLVKAITHCVILLFSDMLISPYIIMVFALGFSHQSFIALPSAVSNSQTLTEKMCTFGWLIIPTSCQREVIPDLDFTVNVLSYTSKLAIGVHSFSIHSNCFDWAASLFLLAWCSRDFSGLEQGFTKFSLKKCIFWMFA